MSRSGALGRRRAFATVAFAATHVMLVAAVAHAAAGDLDSTFGTGGKVTTDFGAAGITHDEAFALVRQTDGKVVAAGTTAVGSGNHAFALARYTVNGALDPTFGGDGKVVTDFSSGIDEAHALAIQADGKLVAAGFARVGTGYQWALARYLTSGALDGTFGVGGKVVSAFVGGGSASAIVARPGGKLFVAGSSGVSPNTNFTVRRYLANGTIDATYGVGGTVTTDFGGGFDHVKALLDVGSGKVVAAGLAAVGGTNDFALARYTATGALDGTFGTGGKVTTDFASGSDSANAIVLRPNGKMNVAGVTYVGGTAANIALARYTAAGVLDATFGTGGRVTTNLADFDRADALVLQGGKLLVAGTSGAGENLRWLLARYFFDGALDATFGVNGTVTTDVGDVGGPDSAYGVVLAEDKAVVAGSASQNFTPTSPLGNFGLARYLL